MRAFIEMVKEMVPLKGMRVLDLSRVLAGPLCAQGLGDLGAEIIKVETLVDGDESRSWPPFSNGMATAFMAANRNKQSIALDLKKPDGLKIVHELVRTCDVVVESASAGVAERLGVDYPTLKAINDRIVYCTISGFGRTGPMKDARGYDMILQAYSGMMSVTGSEDGNAIRIPFSPIDQTTGYHAIIGVLSALMQRGVSGKGSLIDVSLFETAASFLGYMAQAYMENGTLPKRSGSQHSGIVPYQAFECRDKSILVGIANDKLWRAFCNAFGYSEFAIDARFALNRDRVANRHATVAIVQEAMSPLAAADALEKLDRIGVPSAPINNLQDLIENPQTTARGLIGSFNADYISANVKAFLMPILFDGQPRNLGSPPPRLGEHTDIVLTRLGYTPMEIQALERDQVIGRMALPHHTGS